MKAIYDFFVRLPKAFNDEVEVGDTTIYIDPKWNEFENRKMEAEIVAVPLKYDTGAEVGDTLYFHHHVLIAGNGTRQRVQDDIYYVKYNPNNSQSTQAYAYKNKDGDVQLLSEWIFLDPEDQPDEAVTESGIITELKKPDFNQFGYVIYDSPAVKKLGLNAGDKVMIMKNADYRMKVDGKEVYRTHIDHIYATGF